MSGGVAVAVPVASQTVTVGRRVHCSFCGRQMDAASSVARVPSNVRRFKHETFELWRCGGCACIHCLDVVDLQQYYADYPIARRLTGPLRLGFDNLCSRLTRHGFTRQSTLLDYGCGAGLFLEHLREQGYLRYAGYDPYSSVAAYRDPANLAPHAFDFIVLQDVLEHVEEPRELFGKLDACLRPGGHLLVGTPNAGEIRLGPYELYWLHLHPPYHLHVYTREAVEAMGRERGWTEVDFFKRSYLDTRTPGINMQAIVKYQWFNDGTLDASMDFVSGERLRRSPNYMLKAWFGYWWRKGGDMTIVFRKPGLARANQEN